MWGEELTVKLLGMTILGSVIVAAAVAKLKVWLKTKGWMNTLLALAVGALLGGLVYLVELAMSKVGIIGQGLPLLVALLDGIFSGGVAAGLWKAARTVARKD